LGAGFVPQTLNTEIYDGVITVANQAAFDTARDAAAKEGLLVGISSGAAIWAALELAKKPAFSSRVPVWMNNIYAYFEILIRLMQNGLFSTISNFINLNTRYKVNIFFENGNTFK